MHNAEMNALAEKEEKAHAHIFKIVVYLVLASWVAGRLVEFSEKPARRAPKPKRSAYERYWTNLDNYAARRNVEKYKRTHPQPTYISYSEVFAKQAGITKEQWEHNREQLLAGMRKNEDGERVPSVKRR